MPPMNTTPGRAGDGTKTAGSCGSESREFGNVSWNARHTDPTDHDSVTKNGHATGIDCIGIAVIDLRFTGDDAESRAACKRDRRLNRLTGKKVGGECATAVGIFDTVEISGGSVVYPGWKVNAADEANGARGKRGLIVAEIGGSASESDGQIVYIDGGAEISGVRGGGAWFPENGEDFSAAIDDGDDHGIEINGSRGSLDNILNVDSAESGDSDWRRDRAWCRSCGAAACEQEGESRSDGERENNSEGESATALFFSAARLIGLANSVFHERCSRSYRTGEEVHNADSRGMRRTGDGRGSQAELADK